MPSSRFKKLVHPKTGETIFDGQTGYRHPKYDCPASPDLSQKEVNKPIDEVDRQKPTIKPTKPKPTVKPAELKPTIKPTKPKPTIKPTKPKPTIKPAKPKPTIKPKPAGGSTISGRITGERRFVKKVGASNLDRPGQPITATVDASGHYRISNLPDGRYRVYPMPRGKFDLLSEPRHRDVTCQGRQSHTVDFEIKGIFEG